MKTLGIQVIILQIFTGHLCSAQNVRISAKHEAVLGGNVTFKCALMGSNEVLQVTWQMMNDGRRFKNMATFSEKYGSNIFGSFKGRAAFIPSQVTESIITLFGMGFEDEGCYQCLFNTFPDGAKVGKTCLSVNVKPEPTLQFRPTDTAPNRSGYYGFEATCSATGRPAPVITWNTTGNVKVLSIQSSTMDLDRRVKITSNLTVATADAANSKVICVVNHPALERAITLEDFLETTSLDQQKDNSPIWIAFATIIGIVVVCLAIWYWRNKWNNFKCFIQNNDPGISPNPKTTIIECGTSEHLNNTNDPAEVKLIYNVNQNIKQRFSPLKVKNDSPDKATLKYRSPERHRKLNGHSQNSSPRKILFELTKQVLVNTSPSRPSLHSRKNPYNEQSERPCDRKEKSCKQSLQKMFSFM